MLTVYGMHLSGNCHKIRMVLDHLGMPFRWIEIDVIGGETRTSDFLARNPNGRVPVVQLETGEYLWESNAIIHFLANGSLLWPEGRLDQAETLKWMFFEQYSHEPFVAVARFIQRFLPEDHERRSELPALRASGHQALAVMEQRLGKADFLATDSPTLADVALFAYTHVAGEGGIELARYPGILAWLDRLLGVPGFSAMGN